jgi:MarR family
MAEWKFLSNHAQVLLCIAQDPDVRLRDIAASVGITERATHRIVDELVEGGYVSRKREGRRNHYKVKSHLPLRDPLLRDRKLADVLELFVGSDGRGASNGRGPSKRGTATRGRKRA